LNSPSVAIVILNWNGKEHLATFLPSVLKTTYSNQQVCVADNGSTDDSVPFLVAHYPGVRIIQNGVNAGFAQGYNMALDHVKADYYVLLNSDVEVQPGWLEPLVELMERDPGIGACQPKLIDWTTKTRLEYAGGAGGWLDAFGYPFCRGRVFDICEEDKGQYDDVTPIFWASGAALMIRSRIYHELGGFDPFFFAHMEEIDLCWRLQLKGYKVYACPLSVVYHLGGGTLPKGNKRKVFLNFRNNLIMLTKNMPFAEKIWKIPVRIALDAVSAWKNLLMGESSYFFAVMKAHGAWMDWMVRHRKKSLFPEKKDCRVEGCYHGNIAWDHFVKGKTRFSEIVKIKN
jgi:GT2 family glycosyltransferase